MIWSGVISEEVTFKLGPGRKELALLERAGEAFQAGIASAMPRWDRRDREGTREAEEHSAGRGRGWR